MVSLTVFWCLLGLYSKNLAYRLYNSSKFLEMVRLHAKVSPTFITICGLVIVTYFWGGNEQDCAVENNWPPLSDRKWALNCKGCNTRIA